MRIQTAARPRADKSSPTMVALLGTSETYEEIDGELEAVEQEIKELQEQIAEDQKKLDAVTAQEKPLQQALETAYDAYLTAAEANDQAGESFGYGINPSSAYAAGEGHEGFYN